MAKRNTAPRVTIEFPSGEVLPFNGRRDERQAEAFTQEETGEGVAAEELKQFIERIERLEEEKKAIADDCKDVYAEAKGRGFDTKAIRSIVRLRAKEPHEREEEEAILELYKSAIGMA
jgi:uncharacterized protein (UPF0335 family)